MSKYAGQLFHPVSHHPVDVYEGFSWPCFFFGCFWYAYKGMWGHAFLAFLLALVTLGLSWFILPFLANKQHYEHLRKQGYLTQEQLVERQVKAQA